MRKRITTLLSVGIFLSGCGTTPADRSISGAGIGAGAGAVLGAVTGLPVFGTAALGAAGGALTGVLTDKNQVNLGEPAWKQGNNQTTEKTISQQPSSRQPSSNKPTVNSISLVTEIQKGLQKLGYDSGPVDGIYGRKTKQAICDYQNANGLIVDGEATPSLLTHIEQNAKLVNHKEWG